MITFADPKEWWLELPPGTRPANWATLPYSHPGRQWEASLGELCLQYLLPWLQATYTDGPTSIQSWLAAPDWPGIWEGVGGCAITWGQRRLILIPSDAIDTDGFTVPQEWVDLPDWAGDYYLAVQVQTICDPWVLRVWGYTSHQTLKQTGEYDDLTRTYSLAAIALETDLASLETRQQLCPEEPLRAALPPLPLIPPSQAQTLLARLSDPDLRFPRLAIPFSTWGALLQDPQWRQQWYRQRCGPANLSPQSPLSRWFDGVIAASWQPLAHWLGSQPLPQLRRFAPLPAAATQVIQRAKVITLDQGLPAPDLPAQGLPAQDLPAQDLQSVSLLLLVTLNRLSSRSDLQAPEPQVPELQAPDPPVSELPSERPVPDLPVPGLPVPGLPVPGLQVPGLQIQVQLHPLQTNTLPSTVSLELYDPQTATCLQIVQSQEADTYIQLNRFRVVPGESFQIQIKTQTFTHVESFWV